MKSFHIITREGIILTLCLYPLEWRSWRDFETPNISLRNWRKINDLKQHNQLFCYEVQASHIYIRFCLDFIVVNLYTK